MEQWMMILVNKWWYMILEKDNQLFFVKNHLWWYYILNFILLLFIIILLLNGIFQFNANVDIGIVLIIISIILSIILKISLSYIKKSKNKNIDELDTIAIIDLDKKILLQKNGDVIVSLDKIEIGYAMQVFSSSRAIEAKRSDGSILLVCGNPFTWGIWPFAKVLKDRWLMK